LGRRDFVKTCRRNGRGDHNPGVLAGVPATAEAQDNPPRGKSRGPGSGCHHAENQWQPRKLTVEPRVTLIDALRNHLDF